MPPCIMRLIRHGKEKAVEMIKAVCQARKNAVTGFDVLQHDHLHSDTGLV